MWPEALPRIETEHLTLRRLKIADADDLFSIYGDIEVMRYTDEDPFPDRATVMQMLASIERLFLERDSLEWALVGKGFGKVVGTCSLHNFNEQSRQAEIGCLLRRDQWGRGYMREALLAVIDYAEPVSD